MLILNQIYEMKFFSQCTQWQRSLWWTEVSTGLYVSCSVYIRCRSAQWAQVSTGLYVSFCFVQIWSSSTQWAQVSAARYQWVTAQSSTDSQWADGHHAGHWAGGAGGHRNTIWERWGGERTGHSYASVPTSSQEILHLNTSLHNTIKI